MSARYRCMTSSVHIYLTVVTGFLIVIFYRNQLQRPSSKEMCVREVHRWSSEVWMFKFYIKKCYIRRTCSSETKQNFKKPYLPVFKFMRNSSDYGRFRTKFLTTLICRRYRMGYNDTCYLHGKFGHIPKKSIFPEPSKIRRNSGNPEKTEILVIRISEKSI